jgi:O-antigen/teichoic acid export membrane protein
LGYGLVGIMTAFLLSHIVIFVLGLILIRVPRPRFSLMGYKELLRVAYPFLFITIFQIIYFRIDSVMLKYMEGYQVVGWYNAAYNIVNALNFVPYLFIIALFPSFAKLSVKDAGKRLTPLFNKAFQYLAMLAVPAAAGIITLSAKVIGTFYTPEFSPAILALRILIVAEAFVFVNYLFGYLLNASGRERLFVKITGGLALFNIGLNFILIPHMSFAGAALATVATELLHFIILYKVTGVPVRFGFLWKVLASAAAMVGVLLLLPAMHLAILILAGMATYGLAMLALRGITMADLAAAAEAFKK